MKLTALSGHALARFEDAARACAPDAVAERALTVVSEARPLLMAFSGWPAAGKDTVPVEVLDRLGVPARHLHFSMPLKREVGSIIDTCRQAGSQAAATEGIADALDVEPAIAARAAAIVYDDAQDPALTAVSRTPAVRELLQWWGTDVRRRQDPAYWVKQALAPAVEAIAAGASCYLSDVRFENEVDGAQSLGFVVVRLAVSRETVRSRLKSRDGLVYDDAALDALLGHLAESSLNECTSFDLVVDNDGTVSEAVDAVLGHLYTNAGLAH